MSQTGDLKKTALFDDVVKAGGKMVPFAGYSMPVQFEGIIKEHHRVRTHVGIFDVSHMGQILFRGPNAEKIVQKVTTNNMACEVGRAVYSPVLLPDGGIIDDVIFYRTGETEWLACVNASNKEKDFAWFVKQADGECEVIDQSDLYAQIAIQGPKAPTLISRIFGAKAAELRPFSFIELDYKGANCIVAATGYTGEAGGEVYVPNEVASDLWKELLAKGEDLEIAPIGLGARDSLRLEMRYSLYGNDIDETTNPLEAGLAWTVKFDKGNFIGKNALVAQKEAGLKRRLVGFVIDGKGIARQGYKIFSGDDEIGVVTSGANSPSTGVAVGMGYVPVDFTKTDTRFDIDLKGLRRAPAVVVAGPFYKREA